LTNDETANGTKGRKGGIFKIQVGGRKTKKAASAKTQPYMQMTRQAGMFNQSSP
jgi:hypothetical protein